MTPSIHRPLATLATSWGGEGAVNASKSLTSAVPGNPGQYMGSNDPDDQRPAVYHISSDTTVELVGLNGSVNGVPRTIGPNNEILGVVYDSDAPEGLGLVRIAWVPESGPQYSAAMYITDYWEEYSALYELVAIVDSPEEDAALVPSTQAAFIVDSGAESGATTIAQKSDGDEWGLPAFGFGVAMCGIGGTTARLGLAIGAAGGGTALYGLGVSTLYIGIPTVAFTVGYFGSKWVIDKFWGPDFPEWAEDQYGELREHNCRHGGGIEDHPGFEVWFPRVHW